MSARLAGAQWWTWIGLLELLDLLCHKARKAKLRWAGLRFWWRPRYALARLGGLAVRWHLRKPAGPGRDHPEDASYESSLLAPEEEDWLGEADAELFPGDADRGVMPERYKFTQDGDE